MSDNEATGSVDPWQMRASDADREKYVAHLQDAFAEGRLSREEYEQRMSAAYEARTFADLHPLLSDLPVDLADVPRPPLTSGQQLELASGRELLSRRSVEVDDSPAVAIFSQTTRGGRWVVPAKHVSVSVMGNVSLDLTEALLESGSVEIRAVAVLGEIVIIVPEDIHVDVVGTGVLGDFVREDRRSVASRGSEAPAGAPVLRVTGAAVLGSVRVRIVPAPDAVDGIRPGPQSPAPLPSIDDGAPSLPPPPPGARPHDEIPPPPKI